MKSQISKWPIVITTLVSLMFVVTGLDAKKDWGGGAVGDLNCKECVDAQDIAKSAVTNSKIKKGAVSNSKLGSGAVSTSKLASQAVTTSKINDHAVTVSKVAPELRNAIGTSCPAGEFVVGMDASGHFVCESKHVQVLDPDLTGKTYCFIAQGIELNAEGGLSAQVELNPIHTRMDFTSPTQVTVMDIAGYVLSLNFPSYTMSEQDDPQVSEGTYTMVGSQLAVTIDDPDPDDDEPDASVTFFLTLTPDGQAFIGSLTWRGVEVGYEAFGNYLMMGVQADSCG